MKNQVEKHDSRKKHDTNLVSNKGLEEESSETTTEVEANMNSPGENKMKDLNSKEGVTEEDWMNQVKGPK